MSAALAEWATVGRGTRCLAPSAWPKRLPPSRKQPLTHARVLMAAAIAAALLFPPLPAIAQGGAPAMTPSYATTGNGRTA